MKIWISAGEASGDLHGAALAGELRRQAPSVELAGMGGDAMLAAGVDVRWHIRDHGVMGIWEIITHLPALFRLKDEMTAALAAEKPDALVVIDYPGFNTRLAKAAKKLGIPVLSFISPAAWAWRPGRAKKTAAIVDQVAAIFPFEYDIYREAGADTVFVGHPLLDVVKPSDKPVAVLRQELGLAASSPVLLLLPGSRKQEIAHQLEPMLAAAALLKQRLPDLAVLLLQASTITAAELEPAIQRVFPDVKRVQAQGSAVYDMMRVADAAIATSGTVTLEAALCGLPTVIVYRTSPLTAWIARRVLRIAHIGLPNIVADKRIFPELLQEQVTPENMAVEAAVFLDKAQRAQVLADLQQVRQKMGEPGAVGRVARLAIQLAQKK